MASIENIRDPEIIKQMALLLEKENARLHKRLTLLIQELAALRGDTEAQRRLELEVEKLQEENEKMRQKLFGDSSERRGKPDGEGEPGGTEGTDESPTRRKGHGPRAQAKLPVQEVLHGLEPEDRKCTVCEGTLQEWPGQTEDSEEISVVERSFVVRKHRRKKYRCQCNASVVTAPGPAKLIEGGRYSVEFAVEVAAGKYLDHLPLDRQARIMGREGLEIETQTLWDQEDALARHLEPTYEALWKRVRAAPLLGADETWWRLMKPEERKRWWTWCLATPDAAVYRLLDSRSKEAAREILAGYCGTVLTDGYAVYRALSGEGASFLLAHCWAHVRRKYVEVEGNYPRECAHILALIGKLYQIERDLPDLERLQGAQREEALRLRACVRAEQSRPIVKEIQDWAYAQAGSPGAGLRKAIEYMLSLWQGLIRFLEDPRVPLDNNAVERALRGPVVGRKNHYGSRSKRGTEVAAILYSLLETAKLCGLNPKAYLIQAARAAIVKPGTILLPHDLVSQAEPPAAASA